MDQRAIGAYRPEGEEEEEEEGGVAADVEHGALRSTVHALSSKHTRERYVEKIRSLSIAGYGVVVCDRCCYGADLGKAGGEMEIVWSEAGDVGVTLKDECGGLSVTLVMMMGRRRLSTCTIS